MSHKKDTHLSISVEEDAQIQHILEHYHQIADDLHVSTSRQQADAALATFYGLSEDAQMALLKLLAKENHSDSADVLLAINELSLNKAVRKEAHRSLIRLTEARIYPSWTPKDEAPLVAAAPQSPRFWKGSVTQMREQGELQLTLSFEQGYDFGEARLFSFLLDFWQEGVKDFHTEVGTKRSIDAKINNLDALFSKYAGEEKFRTTDCTLAEGRRLIEEALSVNQWRGTRPHEDYRHYLPTVQQLILNATDPGIDRGLIFVDPDLEPDEVVGHFIGGWSMGDYGLCYDLLSTDSRIRDGLTRDEWLELRRKWADEAHPARLQLGFLHESEHNPQSLWLPSSALSSRAMTQREIDTAWSLELSETQLSGTLQEMAMGTAVNKETRRHWFWTRYTLVQDEDVWLIQRMSDEGANAQGLPIAELQNRLKASDDRVQELTKQRPTTETETQELVDELVWRLIQTTHYDDALLVKLPLDRALYEDAFSRAINVNMPERAIVYLERMEQRFTSDRASTLRQLASVEATLSDVFEQRDDQNRSIEYVERAEASVRKSLEIEDHAVGHLILGELLMHKEQLDEAETHLEQARAMNPPLAETIQIEIDLGTLARAKEAYDTSLSHYQRALALRPNDPAVRLSIGQVYRLQKNYPEAELSFQRAMELQPGDVRIYTELANLYLITDRLSKAREIVEQGLRNNPRSAHLRAVLSSIVMEEGDQRRAEALVAEAERINPSLEIVQFARQALEEHKTKKK